MLPFKSCVTILAAVSLPALISLSAAGVRLDIDDTLDASTTASGRAGATGPDNAPDPLSRSVGDTPVDGIRISTTAGNASSGTIPVPSAYTGAAQRHPAWRPWNENGLIGHAQLVEKAHSGRIDLYFLGDSITRRWGATDYPQFLAHWRRTFFGWNAANFGWGGDGTQHMLWRIRNGELDGLTPKAIVLLAGTNNIGQGDKPGCAAEVAEGVAALIETCREKAPDATIIVMAIFPRNDGPGSNTMIDEANRLIARLADGKKVRFLNINDQLADPSGQLFEGVTVDRLHLSLAGYEIWARNLIPLLTELLGPRANEDRAPPPTGDPAGSNRAASS
jgi:lysophospholipase L1-like esterase